MRSDTANPVEVGDGQRAVRLNVTVKAATHTRLQEARNRRGMEINVSEVTDRAINAELDRLEKPGVSELVERLRIESDRRRGEPYRRGHQEGSTWAKSKASWAEICYYADLKESDLRIEKRRWTSNDGERVWWIPGFTGTFRAPEQDYGLNQPGESGAPAYQDEKGRWIDDFPRCDQYWRGWLAGVYEIFMVVKEDLEPIPGIAPAPAEFEREQGADPDDDPPVEEHGVRDVDPDDIR
jgi:hypothetical protein